MFRNPTNDPNGPYCFTQPGDLDGDDLEDRSTKVFKDHIVYCDIPKCESKFDKLFNLKNVLIL